MFVRMSMVNYELHMYVVMIDFLHPFYIMDVPVFASFLFATAGFVKITEPDLLLWIMLSYVVHLLPQLDLFLQGVSIACYAESCIGHRWDACLSVCLPVTLALSEHNAS